METASPADRRPEPGTAADAAQETTDFVKERAGALWSDAKASARTTLNEKKDAAADGVDGVAGALRDAARRNDGNGERNAFANLSGSAADGLDRLSSTLRNKDVGTMLRDVESFAREQPVAFFGLALAVGFLGVRFIKASNP